MQKFLLLSSFIFCFLKGFSQWTQTNGPEGGYCREIIEMEDLLIISAGNGGVYASTDDGFSWQSRSSGIPKNYSVHTLIENNGVLYASVVSRGIFKSTDKGLNWTPINTGIEYQTFYSLLVDGNNIYAGNANGGITYSNDGGESWIQAEGVTSSLQIQDFVIYDSKVYAGAGYNTSNAHLFESVDGGASWETIEVPGIGLNGVRTLHVKLDAFYLGGDGELWISNDNLKSWTKSELNTYATILNITDDGNSVYLTSYNGRYFQSDDNFVSWRMVENTKSKGFVHDLLVKEGKIFMTSDDGPYQSLDNGVSWTSNKNGIRALQIKALHANDDYLFVGTERDGIYRSQDNGNSWMSSGLGLSSSIPVGVLEIIEVENVLYIATNQGLFSSEDNGGNWIQVLDPGNNKRIDVLAFSNGTLITANSNSMFLSSNKGNSWTEKPIEILKHPTSFTSLLAHESKLILGTADGELLLSDNLGNTWSDISIPDGYTYTYDIKIFGEKLYAATARGLYLSNDFGENWRKLNDENISVLDIIVEPNIIYAATNRGFRLTTEDHNEWFPVSEGLEDQAINKILVHGQEIFAGTFANSVWKLPKEQSVIPQYDSGFVTKWKTDNYGESEDNQITIPTFPGEIYDYSVDWGDGNVDSGVSGDITHTYESPGIYTVTITGQFPRIYFNDSELTYRKGDSQKIISVQQWGDNPWTSMEYAFALCSNLKLNAIDVPNLSRLTNLNYMFYSCYNLTGASSISNWDVSQVTTMYSLFSNTRFNKDISSWDVSKVWNFGYMFSSCEFNQDINEWNVGNAQHMAGMFVGSQFNQNLSKWNVGKVRDMSLMFTYSSFNQDISMWDVGNLTNMERMFSGSNFDQDIGGWNVTNVMNMQYLFDNSDLSRENYDNILSGWSQLPELQRGVSLGASISEYCSSEAERQVLLSEYEWVINDSGKNCEERTPFVTTWKTDNQGASNNNQITIPTNSYEVYDYSIDWGDGTVDTNVTGNITHTYNIPGTYTVSINGKFPGIYFDAAYYDENDHDKILSIDTWGNNKWVFFYNAFAGCSNLDLKAVDIPDLSRVDTTNRMFYECSSLVGNSSINLWQMGAVQSTNQMFYGTEKFNQPLYSWDVGNLFDMSEMFKGSKTFDQDLSTWNISSVYRMENMFEETALSTENYDNILNSWSSLPTLRNDVGLGVGSSMFCEAEEARQRLIDEYGWIISDGGKDSTCPVVEDYVLLINAGGVEEDFEGRIFLEDNYFDGGNTLDRPQTGLSEPFKTFRYSKSQQMEYSIPLENGDYTINMYFAELWFGATGGGSGGVGSRVFDVNIEGQLVQDNLDVFEEAGADAILMKSYQASIRDGELNINFDSRNEVGGERHPIINAFEILRQVIEPEERPFVTTWRTDNEGDSADNQITIPTNPNEQYDYKIDWGDGTSNTGVTGNITHTYNQIGTYQVSITGIFPAFMFGSYGISDRKKITEINQWGDIEWHSFESAFSGCTNLTIPASDLPNLQNVKSLSKAFSGCSSLSNNRHFENWDVSTVEDMSQLFSATPFNQDIGNWDVGQVKNTYAMFYQTPFNQDIGNWDTSNVEHMRQMFYRSQFNQDIGAWNVSKVRNTEQMFSLTPFDQDIGDWDMGSANNISSMFQNTPFNQDIGNWDVGNVERMSYLFDEARNFNHDIGKWNVSKVKYMQGMFRDAVSFNQDLSGWNTENLIIAQRMFRRATSFNQDLGSWNIENVTNMEGMFTDIALSTENYDYILNSWSSQNVQSSVEFDGGVSQYCKSQVGRQRLTNTLGWVIVDGGRKVDCDMGEPGGDFVLRFNTGGEQVEYNGDTFLTDNNFIGESNILSRPQTGLAEPYQSFRFSREQRLWYNIPLEDGEYKVVLHFAELWFGATGGGAGGVGSRVFDVNIEGELVEDNLDVFAEVGAESKLVKTHTVMVTDGELNIDFDSRDEVGGERHPIINAIEILGQGTEPEERPFVTTWKTDNSGVSANNQITIPTFSEENYNYSVDWGDGNFDDNVSGDITHTYETPGTYQVSISGNFPRIHFWYNRDNDKIISVDQWGDTQWTSMARAFALCSNLNVLATDLPDLSLVKDMQSMFYGCRSLVANETLREWDTSNIEIMQETFGWTDNFNQDISTWDVSKVTNMRGMFISAKSFNQPIGKWNVSSVQSMENMFYNTSTFNKPLNNWDTGNVKSMSEMFFSAESFDQALNNWDVSGVSSMNSIFVLSGLSDQHYDETLIGWSDLPELQNGVVLNSYNQYCHSMDARQFLIDNFNWDINDRGRSYDCPIPDDFSLSINSGGTSTTYNNETFADDQYFDTGSTLDRPQTGLPEPYQTFRFSRSQQMRYTIPVPNGEYTVKLHFAELWFGATGGGAGGTGLRVFDVSLESNLVENDLDIYAEVGAEAMLVKTHTVNVTDGELNIDFDSRDEVGGQRHPVINGIEIIRGSLNGLSTTAEGSGLKKTSLSTSVNEMILYPNQASTTTYISFTESSDLTNIDLFDMSGKWVKTYPPEKIRVANEYMLDVSTLTRGQYYVKATDHFGNNYSRVLMVIH